jgi:hypothetical protein
MVSKPILDKAGIAATLPSGDPDPGVLLASVEALDNSAAAFIAAAGKLSVCSETSSAPSTSPGHPSVVDKTGYPIRVVE